MVQGNIARMWFDFTGDLMVCTDPSSSGTAITMPISQGTRFMIPLGQAIRFLSPVVLCYVKSVSGSQSVVVTCVMASLNGGTE